MFHNFALLHIHISKATVRMLHKNGSNSQWLQSYGHLKFKWFTCN